MTRIGFNHITVSCYCRGCYHIFTTGYNSCTDYLGGDDRCPFCGTNEKVIREDTISIKLSMSDTTISYLKDKPRKLKQHLKEMEEIKRIGRLLEAYGEIPGWYPPEDYPMCIEENLQ